MAKKFNLGDYLKDENVSRLDTEQIVYIDLDRIDPDPANFYSLDGLDELAGNIELIGLQQPLRVRPEGERFVIVSGHRRRAACMLIRDGGSDQFARGVPCIVDYGEASPAMRELRLIYANSSTRVLTSAELSKQAERVMELLYELKSQGVAFPGRMREHVAAACRVSESKLARLAAIRNRLVPGLLNAFDRGSLKEGVAYRISQETPETQAEIWRASGISLYTMVEGDVDVVLDQIRKKSDASSASSAAPSPQGEGQKDGRLDLSEYMKERLAEDLRYLDMMTAKRDEIIAALPIVIHDRQQGIDILKRTFRHRGSGGERVNYEGRGNGFELFRDRAGEHILRSWTEAYDMLCCAAINYLGKNSKWADDEDEDEPPTAAPPAADDEPEWQTGDPPRIGRYFCRVDMGDTKPHENRCWWGDDGWSCYGTSLEKNGWKVTGWWPLPKEDP